MGLALKDVSFVYQPGTPLAREVLQEIDLEIREGEVLCLLGRTGSGKSTLLQVAAGILQPSRGRVLLDGVAVTGKREGHLLLREAVGVLLQSSEAQLFAETVERDISFGLRHLGLSRPEKARRVAEAMRQVGLEPARYATLSPFGLSEGEMRRVALAGVLVRRPRLLLLDEPFSGLDGAGREELFRILLELRKKGAGILLVTHEWEEVDLLADRAVVLSSGRIHLEGTKESVLSDVEGLLSAGLQPPPRLEVLYRLRQRIPNLPAYTRHAAETAEAISLSLSGGET